MIAEDGFSKITHPPPNSHTHGWFSFYAANMKDIWFRETKNNVDVGGTKTVSLTLKTANRPGDAK